MGVCRTFDKLLVGLADLMTAATEWKGSALAWVDALQHRHARFFLAVAEAAYLSITQPSDVRGSL